MRVKEKLTPYMNRMYQAYLFKIGLVSMGGLLMALFLVEVVSKLLLVTHIWLMRLALGGLILMGILLWAYIKRPKKTDMYRQIDGLGFENRLMTYLEYADSENPFKDYLEADLLKSLSVDRYKQINRRPQGYYFLGVVLMAFLFGGSTFIETEVSKEATVIAEDIQQIEAQAQALEEVLKEEIPDLQDLKLAREEMNDALEVIKENLRQKNLDLAEQNLFKMEESLERRLTGEGLPEAVDGIMEGIKEVALERDGPKLLASLSGQETLADNALSQTDIDASTADGSGKNQDANSDSTQNNNSDSGNEQNDDQNGDGT